MGAWKDSLIGHLERDHWPLLWPAVPSAKSSFLPAPSAPCFWVWREACPYLHPAPLYVAWFPIILKAHIPSPLFYVRLVPLLNSSLPRLAALILPAPLLTLHMSSWGEIPWLHRAMAKRCTCRRTRHPWSPSPISRISLTLIKCDLFVNRKVKSCRLFFTQLYMWFIYLGISNTEVTHVVKVTKLLFLLAFPIIEHEFSCQIMQEARENSSYVHVEPTNPHGFCVLLSLWVLRNAAASSLAWIQSF